MIKVDVERRELRLSVDEKLYNEVYDFINVHGIIDQSSVTYGNTDSTQDKYIELTVILFSTKWGWKELIASLSNKDDREFLSEFISSNIDYYNDKRSFCTPFIVFRYKEGK